MQLAINEIHQSDAAWHRQVGAGRKSVETPGQILQIGSAIDLEALTDTILATLPGGLSAPFAEAGLLPSAGPIKSLQLTLERETARDAAFVRGNAVILLDPSTQILHSGWREKRAQFAGRECDRCVAIVRPDDGPGTHERNCPLFDVQDVAEQLRLICMRLSRGWLR